MKKMPAKASTPNLLDQKQVSCFKSATSKLPEKTATLGEIFRQIETGRLPLQEKIRKLQEKWQAAKDEFGEKSDEAKAIYKEKQKLKEKSWLPAFSLSALFNGKRANENVAQHTGLLQIDIDHLENATEWTKTCKALQKSPYIWKLWRSISGDGIKGALLIPPDVKTHKDAFRAAAEHIKQLTGKDIDEACKDPARICFFSQSKVWTNPEAFPIDPVAAAPIVTNGSTEKHADSSRLEAQVRALGEQLLGGLGEWQKDERQRLFAYCRCPDVSREHHFEDNPNTRLYLNPGSVPRIQCAHGECAPIVKARNDLLRKLFFDRENTVSLPEIQDMAGLLKKPIVLPPDIIDTLLSRGGKMLLGGGSKSFKTWMLIDIATAVVTGSDWLGLRTKAGRVLYINLELQSAFFSFRNKTVLERKSLDLCQGQYEVWNLRGHAADLSKMLPSILEKTEKDKYDLIIFDPIYKVLGDREENVSHHMTSMMNDLEKIAMESGAAVIFGAHFSKGNQSLKESIDRVSGSGALARDPDSILIFTKHEQQNAFVVEATLRNHPPMEPFCVTFDFPLMKIASDLNPADLKQAPTGQRKTATTSADKIVALLDAEPLAFADWSKVARDTLVISQSTFEKYFRIVRDDGRIKKTEDEKWAVVGNADSF
jgi:hypothetical protein